MPWRKMKDELTCPICLELFSHPRRLPCGHSYCHNCIQAMLEKRAEQSGYYYNRYCALVCPECREELSFDYVKGIVGIPTDFKLSKLVELFHFIKAKDDSDSCDETKSSSLGSSTPGFQAVSPSSEVSPEPIPGDHSTSGTVNLVEFPAAPTLSTLGTPPDTGLASAILQPASRVPSVEEPVSDSALGAVGGVSGEGNAQTLSSESPHVTANHHGVQNPINCFDFIIVQHSHLPSPGVSVKTVLSQDSDIPSPSDRAYGVPSGATKHQNSAKTKRSKKSSWKSLFVSDSSSTDSSSSDSHISQGSRSSSGLKNKRWLMTRFLKSVIFSESSSSDDSDDSSLRPANARVSSAQLSNSTAGYVSDSIANLTAATNVQQNVQHEKNASNFTVSLTESISSPLSSATLVKEPVERAAPLNTRPWKPLAEATPQLFTETDCGLTLENENQPTLYDNLNSRAGHDPLPSTYDNAKIRDLAGRHPNGVSFNRSAQDGNSPLNRLPDRHIESGPRTHYDNVGDSHQQHHGNCTLTPSLVCTTQSSIFEIENLKTGFEQISDPPFCSHLTTQSVTSSSIPNTEDRNPGICQDFEFNQEAREGVCLPEGFGELVGSPAVSERLMSPYDNLSTQETSSVALPKMSQDNPTSLTLVLITPDAESVPGAGAELFPRVYGQLTRTDNDFEFDDNYFDTSSEEMSERDLSHLNLAPSSFALDGGESSLSRSASGGPLTREGADNASDTKQNPTSKSQGKDGRGRNSSEEEEEEDDGSHPGTSMLQNKRKPRSRLKKFLTSLLSLSSSDDEDEHFDVRTSSSSKSSDW